MVLGTSISVTAVFQGQANLKEVFFRTPSILPTFIDLRRSALQTIEFILRGQLPLEFSQEPIFSSFFLPVVYGLKIVAFLACLLSISSMLFVVLLGLAKEIFGVKLIDEVTKDE